MFGGESDNKVAISVTMYDGNIVEGKVDGGATKSISTALNRDGDFIELILPGRRKKQLSKRYIMSVEPAEDVQKPDLNGQVKDNTDPYAILKVSRNADAATLKAAYIHLCRQYHPDNYHDKDLPEELQNYINEMFKLVNNAYRQVSQHAA